MAASSYLKLLYLTGAKKRIEKIREFTVCEALCGVFSSALAIVCGFGVVFYLGVPISPLTVAAPFLILAIGIDDAYILLGCWKNTKLERSQKLPSSQKLCSKQLSRPLESLKNMQTLEIQEAETYEMQQRLTLTLLEAGPGILLTSLTDVASFGIGTISQTPAVTGFCVYCSVGILMDFLFQLTFFPAVMVLGARFQNRRRQKQKSYCHERKILEISWCVRLNDLWHKSVNFALKMWETRIVRAVLKFIVIVLYVAYLGLSFYGCSQATADLKTTRVIREDSYATPYLNLLESKIWNELLPASVYVLKPPDFRNETEDGQFKLFLDRLHNSSFFIHSEFWLTDFEHYLRFISYNRNEFYDKLRSFLKLNVYKRHKSRIVKKENDDIDFIDRFMFETTFKHAGTWKKKIQLLKELRSLAADFPQFDISFSVERNYFVDQVANLPDTSMQTIAIALFCMGVIAIIFFAHSSAIFWVCYSLVSIDVGVIGLLILWGADFDPMSVIDIVMSIGFCIDFTAHFCFQYYRSNRNSIIETYRSIGWPLLQCGLSTMIAVLPLCIVASYAFKVFTMSVLLVVGLGLVHAFVIMPVLITTFSMKSKKNKRSSSGLKRHVF